MQYLEKAPYEDIVQEEVKYTIFNFATLVSLLKGKKLNFQQVFATLLLDEAYRDVLKDMLKESSDMEIYRQFLSVEPSVANSKYVAKIIRSINLKKESGDN